MLKKHMKAEENKKDITIEDIEQVDNVVKVMYSQLNEEKINKYSDNSDIPLMQLELQNLILYSIMIYM